MARGINSTRDGVIKNAQLLTMHSDLHASKQLRIMTSCYHVRGWGTLFIYTLQNSKTSFLSLLFIFPIQISLIGDAMNLLPRQLTHSLVHFLTECFTTILESVLDWCFWTKQNSKIGGFWGSLIVKFTVRGLLVLLMLIWFRTTQDILFDYTMCPKCVLFSALSAFPPSQKGRRWPLLSLMSIWPNNSPFKSHNIRRSMFLNYIKFVERCNFRHYNCEMFGRR